MIFKIKHFAINWIDGMKISKDHFIETNNYIIDLIRDSNSVNLNSYNYGLLPSEEPFEIILNKNNTSNFFVSINNCYAITLGGFKINFDSKNKNLIYELINIQENSIEIRSFYIILIANPYQQIPIGTPLLDENPLRHPYTDIHYTLDIIATNEINVKALGCYNLLLGKLTQQNNQILIEENYIPPCTSINSHIKLIEYYGSIIKIINHLEITSLKIIKKIQDKNKPSSLSKNIYILCTNILSFISTNSYTLLNELIEKEPIKTIGLIASLAHNQHITIKCMPENEQEEILKYFFEWIDLAPKYFEDVLLSSSNVRYEHYEINQSMEVIIKYLSLTEKILNKMNTLEFIGQRKENMVVTQEIILLKEEQTKKRWSILD